MSLALRSAAFEHGGEIPAFFTCEGRDLSPPLEWSGLPDGTETLALIADDPDAPRGTWVHWIVYDIPAGQRGLREGMARLPNGARAGRNSWGRARYGGPCPPSGRHRYFFRLFALDCRIGPLETADKPDLLAAMEGHVLATAELMGTYRKRGAST
jgi:Raf kinase inhibitor-like YbhB/YbcL family protein